ncbi:MAG: fused MFS/spermidine synthase [Acetatifactor muris]|nr:fused MFS/spermidine synthase [Acetatifactor muris]
MQEAEDIKVDKKRSILGNKIYLYLTEFFAGMSVMAVELGASRLLAPYFSSSQIVWTIIIGTIMIAMALGNVWGGRSADKNPNPDRLYGRILIAAIWIAAIPVFGKYIIVGISGLLIITVSNQFLIIAAFISCMVLFVFPLFLLGTVTPSLAKYAVGNLEESGKTIGTLGAFNTIGSIIGTFVPTFISIPAVGTSVTFLIFAAILLALALIYFICEKRRPLKAAVSVVPVLLCSLFGHSTSFAFWEEDLTYEGESIYNYLQVSDTPVSTILSTNVLFGVQSITMKGDSLTGLYYDYALAAPYMTEQTKGLDILILGMGTGTYAGQCSRYLEEAKVEGVEIDSRITELAHRYFGLSEDVKVTTYDGRAYLQAVEEKYDVIMVDAYQDITIPFQMSTVEFFTLVREHLKENGVMVVNMNMHSSENLEGDINVYLADTISKVFPEVYTADVPYCTNRELFASMNPAMLENLRANTVAEENGELRELLEEIMPGLAAYEAGENILTDDRAPVELLGMQMIDSIINDEIGYYKRIFREQGIAGLLHSL